MTLSTALRDLLAAFLQRHGAPVPPRLEVDAPDAWHLRVCCDLPQAPGLCIRSLTATDAPVLDAFGKSLGANTKHLFCPYPWDDPEALPGAFQHAVDQAVRRVDVSYLIETGAGVPIGHFFLWKAGGNPHSQAQGLQIPELGVALVDGWQGKGLGALAVRILQAVARDLLADAIELTTAMTNDAGWQTYQRCGFEYVGVLRIPLGVDVTDATAGAGQGVQFRDERQMACVLNEPNRARVLAYLAAKREPGA